MRNRRIKQYIMSHLSLELTRKTLSDMEATIGKDVWLVFSTGAERNGETDD
jgi:hypothetical protein